MKTTMKAMVVTALMLVMFAPACSIMDNATLDERTAMETLQDQEDAANAAGDPERAAQFKAQREALEGNVVTRSVATVSNFVAPFIPAPLQPLIPFLGSLFFKRVRRTVKTAFKETINVAKTAMTGDIKGTGNAIGTAVDSVLTIVGLVDSRKDTMEEMQERVDELRAAGDETGAATLAVQLAEMKAKTVTA